MATKLSLIALALLVFFIGSSEAAKVTMSQEDMGICNPTRFGSAQTDTIISTAIASTGTGTLPDCSGDTTLLLNPGTWVISNNLTIPARVKVKVPAGAVISINSGRTLTLANIPDCDLPASCIVGDGSVSITAGSGKYTSFITSGCAPTAPVSSLTLGTFACSAHILVNGAWDVPIVQASNTIGPFNTGDGYYWVGVHRNTSSGVTSWTRQGSTHYVWIKSATRPTIPADVFLIARVTVATVITEVKLEARYSLGAGFQPLDPADFGFSPTATAATNTTALQTVATLQAAYATAMFPQVVYGYGVTTRSAPQITLPDGYYQINDVISFFSDSTVNSRGRTILDQTSASKGIFLFNDAYRVHVENIIFMNGTRQISYLNTPANDTSYFRVRNCEFQRASDVAIFTLGTYFVDNATTTTALAADADAGDTVITVVSETGLDSEGQIILVNDAGEYQHNRWSTNTGTSITLRYAIPSHWTGSLKASSGNAVYRGVPYQNAITKITDCWFMYPHRVLEAVAETTQVSDSWVFVTKDNFSAQHPAFIGFGVRLNFSGNLLVPVMGTAYGVDRLVGVRWVDAYLYFSAENTRFGGEDAGMPLVFYFGQYNPNLPWNGTSGISLRDCEMGLGLTGGPEGTHTAIYLARGLPQRIHISGGRAYLRTTAWIEMGSAVDWTAYLATAEAIAGVTFTIDIEGNEGFDTATPHVDTRLVKYTKRHPSPLALDRFDTESITSQVDNIVYLYSKNLNGSNTLGFNFLDGAGNTAQYGPGPSGVGFYAQGFFGTIYPGTSNSGSTSIIDTGITLTTMGNAAAYLVTMTGNPTSAGSGNYRDINVGVLYVYTGWSGSAVTTYAAYANLAEATPAGIDNLTITVHFWNGSAEVTGATGVASGSSNQIRLKVLGYGGTVASSQQVRMVRIH